METVTQAPGEEALATPEEDELPELVPNPDADPMAPDYEALAREPLPLTAGEDSRLAAEAPAIQ